MMLILTEGRDCTWHKTVSRTRLFVKQYYNEEDSRCLLTLQFSLNPATECSGGLILSTLKYQTCCDFVCSGTALDTECTTLSYIP